MLICAAVIFGAAQHGVALAVAADWKYDAVFSCGQGGGSNINILACFAGSASGAATDLSVTRDGLQRLYQLPQLANVQSTNGMLYMRANVDIPDGMIIDDTGLHVLLPEHFQLVAQNSQEHLVLGVKITEIRGRKVVYQQEVGQYGVIKVGN